MDLKGEGVTKRRRGSVLEDALLQAAWEQLVEGGYGLFTFDAVAARAGTSKPVLYRRWATRRELLSATLRSFVTRTAPPAVDTGSLRGDVVRVLLDANESRAAFVAVVSVQLGGFFDETGTSPADLREDLVRGRTSSMDGIIERAIARGEIRAEQVTPRIKALPFDLMRQEALMTLKPVPSEVIEAIVDEIFLPLVASRAGSA